MTVRAETGTRLPVIKVREIRWLVDTGSTTTLVTPETVAKLRKVKGSPPVQACGCTLTTLAGACDVLGEVHVPVKPWTRPGEVVRVHVVGTLGPRYDGILGCDVMARAGTSIRCDSKGWKVSAGKGARLEGQERSQEAHLGAVEHAQEWVEGLKKEYRDVFAREGAPLGVTGATTHRIPLKRDEVTNVREGRYPQAIREALRAEVAKLLDEGVIRHSTSPFNSPIWAVRKKSAPGEEVRYRMVVDYRKLNENTCDEEYPIPRLEDALDRMTGATVFTTLDLHSGYHQIRMHPPDQRKTAFSFERGHFEFTRMPFGLKNAPRTFQRMMDEFLRGLSEDFCHVYVDDVLVFSKNLREHKEHLRRVCDRLRAFGLKISEKKCRFGVSEVTFLGHRVTANGVMPDPQKVAALKEVRMPTTVRGVRGLLGALNYYRKFVPQMAHLVAPLNAMLKKGRVVEWTPAVENGVRRCVEALSRDPVLRYPDFGRTFVVTTDASSYALGAVLAQQFADGEHPIAYASRRLTPAEERYSAIERELLGVVWAIEHFKPYVYGRRFELRTDHKPLQWVGGMRETSARVARWKERLAGYDVVIRHIPGKQNAVADWLSRAVEAYAVEDRPGPSGQAGGLREYFRSWAPGDGEERESPSAGTEAEGTEDTSREDRADIEELEDIVNSKRRQIWWRTAARGLDSVDFQRQGRRSILYVRTTPGVTKERMVQLLDGALKKGCTYHIYVGNEVVWRKLQELRKEERVGRAYTLIRCRFAVTTVTDREQQRELIDAYHVGKTNHRGAAEAVAALKRRYFWDGMRAMVDRVVQECGVCQRAKADTRPPHEIQEVTQTAEGPMDIVEVDTFTWRGHRWVTAVDTFSKMAMAMRVLQGVTDAVVTAIRAWTGVYGIPELFRSDCGPEFKNQTVEAETRRLECGWHYNTPGHAQGRGCVERLHATLSDHLRLLHAERDLDPPQAMDQAIRAYNHSVHSTTGYTPVEVVFGDRRYRRDVLGAPEANVIQQRRAEQRSVWKRVRTRLIDEKERRVLRHNVATRDVSGRLAIGTIVYRRVATNRRKEQERFSGPFKIVALYQHNRVLLEACDGSGRRKTAHLAQLKLPAVRPAGAAEDGCIPA